MLGGVCEELGLGETGGRVFAGVEEVPLLACWGCCAAVEL